MTGGMEQGSSTLGQSGKAVPAGRHIGAAWAGISATTLLVVLPLLIGALFLVASAVIGIGATVLRNREGLDPSAYEVGFAVASFLIVGLVVLVVREVFGVLVDLGARAKAGPTKSVRGDWVRVRRPIGIFAALIIASNLALASLEHPTRLGLGGFQVAPVLVAMGLFIALALGVASMVMVAGV